jgi:hypothetical protein
MTRWFWLRVGRAEIIILRSGKVDQWSFLGWGRWESSNQTEDTLGVVVTHQSLEQHGMLF